MGEELMPSRIVQELVPGKEITIAHLIASPDITLYEKLGLDPRVEYSKSAIRQTHWRRGCSRSGSGWR